MKIGGANESNNHCRFCAHAGGVCDCCYGGGEVKWMNTERSFVKL